MDDADDNATLQRDARMLVHHQDADLASVIQRLAQLANAMPQDANNPSAHENVSTIVAKFCSAHMPATTTQSSHAPYLQVTPHATVESFPAVRIVENARRYLSVIAKASDFLPKLRHLSHRDMSLSQNFPSTRFSFEAGDNTMALSAPLSSSCCDVRLEDSPPECIVKVSFDEVMWNNASIKCFAS
nr:hypothetical protein CFP56_64816 [Quercus suber]